MEAKLEFRISSIDLGIKEGSTAGDDRAQFLEIDEFTVTPDTYSLAMDKHCIMIQPTKWHIQEYRVNYCDACLKEGRRVKGTHGTYGSLCEEHYRPLERSRNPCPKCDTGYMVEGTGDNYCNSCGYREPHVHNVTSRSDGLFALVKNFAVTHSQQAGVAPILDPDRPASMSFMCSCLEWDTPEQHARRREALKTTGV